MDGAGKRRSPPRNGSNARTLKSALIKTAAWVVAIPLLCATVIVGGAVPLYLLLPDAQPGASTPAPPAPKPTTLASAKSGDASAKTASNTPARPTKPADDPPAEAAGDAPPLEQEAAPAEAAEETQVAAVVPTPRPEPPQAVPEAALPPAGDDGEPDEAAPAPQAETPRPEAPSSPKVGKRDVILRTVTLRTGPGGRQTGTLQQGTPVVVGRCDKWCEVRADGASGWVHPSFLAASGAAGRDGDRVVRQVERRRPARGRDPDWMDEDRRDGRYDDDVYGSPPAAFYEERPRVLRGRPPPRQFYDYYD